MRLKLILIMLLLCTGFAAGQDVPLGQGLTVGGAGGVAFMDNSGIDARASAWFHVTKFLDRTWGLSVLVQGVPMSVLGADFALAGDPGVVARVAKGRVLFRAGPSILMPFGGGEGAQAHLGGHVGIAWAPLDLGKVSFYIQGIQHFYSVNGSFVRYPGVGIGLTTLGRP
ncbi:MAG: hypothetical protein L0196_03490 [candidate division Zixibacteria bacterium]|nr:hypothetical protein [candidate division Zixibacteria bacterium]